MKTAPDGEPVGEINIGPAKSWTRYVGAVTIPDGDNDLCLCYEGKGKLDILEFTID